MVTRDDGSGDSGLGWQGSGIDVEIETIDTDGARRYRWTLYDRTRVIRTGACRTRYGTWFASGFAYLIYRFYGRPASLG